MRKKLIIPIMLGLSLLASCGQDTKAEKTDDTAVTTTETTTSAAAATTAATTKTETAASETTTSAATSTAPATTEKATEQQPETEAETDQNEEDKNILKAVNVLRDNYKYFYMEGTEDGTFKHHDPDGNLIDFKNLENYMVYEAENLTVDRVLGRIADEQDLIDKARYLLLSGKGQDYIDQLEKEPAPQDGIGFTRDDPPFSADYYEDYDVWRVRRIPASWTRNDGAVHKVSWSEGSSYVLIRGCDGKVLGTYINY
ncbi:MAG: hypothetical protein K6G33_05080 [Ruminococcus sp.]|uniref:hypothetical protein n=1 Tax=Ruminococcus sp. TaxID=41978 RepID=UPI0025E0B00B|nr:hypothetical protein [Ruminococcus sp.]MCR5600096.1 hypothetical protein [Ruminococcus sp.]